MRKIMRDNLPHLVWCLHRLVRTTFSSFFSRRIAWWWGVSLGKDCIFRGLPIMRRLPGSRICVGDGCMFCSSSDANQGGVARRCILWTLSKDARIEIGKNCGFSGTVINASCEIKIGDGVRCGTNTHIMDSDMHLDDDRVSDPQPVLIENGAWIGMYSSVLKGVTIGEGTIVAAHSLVNKSLPANVLAGGVPARVIRKLGAAELKEKGPAF
jgi:hypothetical protein